MTTDGPEEDTQASAGVEPPADSEAADSFLREIARSPDRAPGQVLTAGTVVAGRFRLERRLGEGGMGIVWAAVHNVTRKPVALKFLKRTDSDDVRAVPRFLREARAACAVRHPSVVEVHDVLELEDGSPVMVMELLTGETLAERLRREGALPLAELARIMVHVCSAVGCAHALGIVHRDLKPENIFLATVPGGGREVKVLDFGIAKLTASEGDAAHTGGTTGTGAILGTPYYMAPEQLFGEKDIDHRADIWALGIIFYEALTGQRPTSGDNVGQIYKVVMTGAITPLSERLPTLPEPMTELVACMLSRERALRPADADAVLSVLSKFTNETFVGVTGPPMAPARSSAVTPEPPLPHRPADAGTTDAPPMEAEAALNRSGIELPLRPSDAGRKRPPWTALGLLAASALTVGGLAAWASAHGPAGSVPGPTLSNGAPLLSVAASVPSPPQEPSTSAAAEMVPSAMAPATATASASTASTAAPLIRLPGKRGPNAPMIPRASASAGPVAGTTTLPLAASASPPVPKPSAVPADPGSYQ